MSSHSLIQLNPINFLQSFVILSIKVAKQHDCPSTDTDNNTHTDYIEHLGLTASSCFENTYREQSDLEGNLDLDQYAELIINIKNQIGGNFSRAASEPGVVRVINTCCPFGSAVKEAPELCGMTSSLFGGIAARNFGYAKVVLNKRLATNDGMCEVCIYTDRDSSDHYEGDEYENKSGVVSTKSISRGSTVRLEERLQKLWCPTNSAVEKSKPKTFVMPQSTAMRQIFKTVERVAPTDASIQISGETGVGKEWIARAIHALSDRWQQPFVAVNCGAIPENLIESALFGHEKGAFTGAYHVHHGYFERADKGTLFLDEIDALPVSAQPRLLRILQEGEFERVGGQLPLKSNFRIICASSHDIKTRVDSGHFRKDLFYRLSVIPIHVPPLRERMEDLSALVSHFLHKLANTYQCKPKVLSEPTWLRAMTYSWPGNIRELENILERAFLFTQDQLIQQLDIADDIVQKLDTLEEADTIDLRTLKKNAAMAFERKIMLAGLNRFSGNISQLAHFMGITPRAVHQKLKSHHIDPSPYRKKS